jgi:hypothetical protein
VCRRVCVVVLFTVPVSIFPSHSRCVGRGAYFNTHPRETAPNTAAHGTAWFPTSPRVVANIAMYYEPSFSLLSSRTYCLLHHQNTPQNNKQRIQSTVPRGRPRRVERPAHRPQCTHTQHRTRLLYHGLLAQATHSGRGTTAWASRRMHLHFEPSRPGWDTTPISITG